MNKKDFERLKKYSQIHLIDNLDSFNEKKTRNRICIYRQLYFK